MLKYIKSMDRLSTIPFTVIKSGDGLDPPTIFSPILNQYFRSIYEVVVAEWLWKNHIIFRYECIRFTLQDLKEYTPDFYLPDHGIFLEVKGLWQGGGRRKFQKALTVIGSDRLLLMPPTYRKWFQDKPLNFLS